MDEQIDGINKLCEDGLKKNSQRGDYWCILIDNLLEGGELAALNLFNEMINDDCIVFLFLMTSDVDFLDQPRDNSRHEIKRYETRPLDPEDAVEFVKHRIIGFRDDRRKDPAGNILFPFDDQDIRQAVTSGNLAQNGLGPGRVTIRQLNKVLADILAFRLSSLRQDYGDDFDIVHVSEHELSSHVIQVAEEYRELLRNR